MSGRTDTSIELSSFAVSDLWKLVARDEIGIGVMFGWHQVTPAGRIAPEGSVSIRIAAVHRTPNLANQVYPRKATATLEARQRAWAFHWSEVDRLAESYRHHGPGFDLVGMVHVHRHAKSLPSALDWRRGKHGMPCAILHPGSNALTLFTFRGRQGGQYLGRVILPGLPPPDTPCQPACDADKAVELLARDGAKTYDMRSEYDARRRAAR